MIYPIPETGQAFEALALRFYRKYLNSDTLEFYGKSGNKQAGIDIFDPIPRAFVQAIQCKKKELGKKLTVDEVEREVQEAESSSIPLARFIIATTSSRVLACQQAVAELNRRPNKEFEVVLHFWEDMCDELEKLGLIERESILRGRDVANEILGELLRIPDVRNVLHKLLGSEPTTSSQPMLAEFDRLMLERNFDTAEYQLRVLEERLGANGSVSERYHLERAKGRLALELCRFEAASKHFQIAFDLNPNDEVARRNYVLSHTLLCNYEQAFALASNYIRDGERSVGMYQNLVLSATSISQIEPFREKLAELSETNSDLATALAHMHLGLGNLSDGQEYANMALRIDSDSAHAMFALGLYFHSMIFQSPTKLRGEAFDNALHWYDQSCRIARQKRYYGLLSNVVSNRGTIKSWANRDSDARLDFMEVLESPYSAEQHCRSAIVFLLSHAEYGLASKYLTKLKDKNQEASFLKICAEHYNTIDRAVKAKSIVEILEVAAPIWKRSGECILHATQWAINEKAFEFTQTIQNCATTLEIPFISALSLSWLALEENKLELAKEHLRSVIGCSAVGAHEQEIELAAGLCLKVGLYSEAIEYLQRIVLDGKLDLNMRKLLHCAQELQKHDLLLRLAGGLRESGETNEEIALLEIELLEHYAPQKGLEVIDQYIDVYESSLFRAFKNSLIMKTGSNQPLDFVGLPKPHELEAKHTRIVVQPLLSREMYQEALQYVYQILRQNLDTADVHVMYIGLFIEHRKYVERDTPAEIVSGCSARIEFANGIQQWFTIEDVSPAASRFEYSAESEVGAILLGKHMGEAVSFGKQLMGEITGVVREIQTNEVRLFQDVFAHFPRRFPDIPFLQQFSVGTEEEPDVTPILDSLRERRDAVQLCFDSYREGLCPIHLIAQNVGLNIWEAMHVLPAQQCEIRCWNCTHDEFESISSNLPEDGELVVDLPAICTIHRLGLWNHFSDKSKLVVSQSAVELIQDWVSKAKLDSEEEGQSVTLGANGGLQFVTESIEMRKERHQLYSSLLENVRTYMTPTSCLSVAAIDAKRLDVYEETIGYHSLEAICLARDLNKPLWTDDSVVAGLGVNEFGIRNIWTQVWAKAKLSRSGHKFQYDLVSGKLVAWKYVTTFWNSESFAAAAKDFQWDLDSSNFRSLVDELRNLKFASVGDVALVLSVVKCILRDCSSLLQSVVMQRLLDAIGTKPKVLLVKKMTMAYFGLDVFSAYWVIDEIDNWLSRRFST